LFRIIAHDLRSPFQGILGITEMLEESYDDFTTEDVCEFIKLLGESASETYSLLENLLEWSNLEVGSQAYALEAISTSELVDRSIRILSTAIYKKNITLGKYIPSDVSVNVDSKMISSVVRNLVGNAIKFTPENGRIEIRGKSENGRLRITISDNGIGLTDEQIEQILHHQSMNSTLGTEGEHGSGIGLYLIHNFLERHDTKLQIVSSETAGTAASFSVALA
jgi:signal transduction histidine kinase